MSSGQPTSQYLLASFLENAFTPDDFITFLHTYRHTAPLSRHLSNQVSSARFFREASLILTQHGLVTPALFAALTAERPARASEIDDLERAICTRPADPPHAQRSPPAASTIRPLVWVFVAVGIALGATAFAVLPNATPVLGGAPADAGASPRPECDEEAEPNCEEGKVCRDHRCIDDVYPAPSTCQVGDECGPTVCECGPGLTCVDHKCTAPAVAPSVCKNPDVLAALKRLRETCPGDMGKCPPTDLKKFAIATPDFDRLMSEFPDTVTLHFRSGTPPLTADHSWPSNSTHEYYLHRLIPSIPSLVAAKHVFIISRSSAFGTERRNDAYARERSTTTKEFILEAAIRSGAVAGPSRDALHSKFYDFLLGRYKPVEVTLFRNRYANRAVTWNADSERMLRDLLDKDEPSSEDQHWVAKVINQVVFIVPVPCELDPEDPHTPRPPT